VFLEKKLSRIFSPYFFGHDIRVFIKKRVFALFPDDFFPSFLLAICVSLEKIIFRVFSPIFWSQYLCVFKNRIFALF